MDSSALGELCIARLRDSYNPSTFVFDRQLRDGEWGEARGTEDLTSTAIGLIGMRRSGVVPGDIGLDESRTRDALIELIRVRNYPGGLGLVAWANAVTGGPPLAEVLARRGWPLDDLPAISKSFRTLEVAWLLAGLVHELERLPNPATRAAMMAIRGALLGRYERRTRLFVHATNDAQPLFRARKWVANFADQIYSIQALSLASIATGGGLALDIAAQSAKRMVSLQGDRGQWWWHYDARNGHVSRHYPVYSVHQHGMAPMALRALAAAGGPVLDDAATKGRRWLADNEMGINMVDRGAGTIWRSIKRDEGTARRVARAATEVLGSRIPDDTDTGRFKVNFETRPYEWAWCLYALG